MYVHSMYTFKVCRQTSFIEISIEAGILRGGKGAIYASVGLCGGDMRY